jgi:Zn finger protein HypA/HybF involved in hydrogenase expression
MHEAGIAQQVIDACAIHLRRHRASQATCVALRIGALANVDPEALRFCFDSLKKDTPLDSAALLIEWRSRFGCACEHTPVVLDGLPGVVTRVLKRHEGPVRADVAIQGRLRSVWP